MASYGRNNFELNAAIALRDVYRLFLVFSGDERIFDLAPEPEDPLRLMRDAFFVDEITHLLVGTAIANRVHLEHMSGLRADPAKPGHQPIVMDCGALLPNVMEDHPEISLTFEQACHKIIHAVHIVPDCGGPSENPLSSEVELRGRLGKATWVAHLSVPQYVRASVMNFRDHT